MQVLRLAARTRLSQETMGEVAPQPPGDALAVGVQGDGVPGPEIIGVVALGWVARGRLEVAEVSRGPPHPRQHRVRLR